MKLSLNYFRISVTGAKLSHLVQKDKIWDHGSMTEQVKNIFHQVEKAKDNNDVDAVRKYISSQAREQLTQLIGKKQTNEGSKKAVLVEVSIIDVTRKSSKYPDRFTALIKGKRRQDAGLFHILADQKKNFGVEDFCERWYFIREGDWWLLDRMRRTGPEL